MRDLVAVEVEGESAHRQVVALLDAPLQRPVQLVGAEPEPAVRVLRGQHAQQDLHRADRAGHRDRPFQLVQRVDRDGAAVPGGQPQQVGALGRAGNHEVGAADAVREAVAELLGAGDVDAFVGGGALVQPAGGLVGLLAVVALPVHARGAQRPAELAQVPAEL